MAQESSPTPAVMGFWCDVCHKDIYASYFVHQSNSLASWYMHRHYCKVSRMTIELKRYADHIKADPYFHKSFDVRRMAQKYWKDLVQPGDPRFAKLYPKQYAEMQAAQERYTERMKSEEEAEWRKDKELTETFGSQGRQALDTLRKEHPELMGVG